MRKVPFFIGALSVAALLTCKGVSAFFTDKEAYTERITVENIRISLSQSEAVDNLGAGLLPNYRLLMDPKVKNEGTSEVIAFARVSSPVVLKGEERVKVFDIEESKGWNPVESKVVGTGKETVLEEVYVYSDKDKMHLIEEGEESTAVFGALCLSKEVDKADIAGKRENISIEVYAIGSNDMGLDEIINDANAAWEYVKEQKDADSPYIGTASLSSGFSVPKAEMRIIEGSTVPDADTGVSKVLKAEVTGDADMLLFAKVKIPQNEKGEDMYILDINSGESEGWVDLGKDEEGNHIYGYKDTLKQGDVSAPLFDKITCSTSWDDILNDDLKDAAIDVEFVGIQADHLPKEDLKDIYELTKEEDKYFVVRKSLQDILKDSRPSISVVEDFPNPPALHAGENKFVKKVQVKNTGEKPAYVGVYLIFSDEEIAGKSGLSKDGGENYIAFSDYKDNLPEGWSYKESEKGIGMYVYDELLAPGDRTSPLFTNINTTFNNQSDVKPFDLYVYAEVLLDR